MSPFTRRALASAALILATGGPAIAAPPAPTFGPPAAVQPRGRLGIQVMELSAELRSHFGAPLNVGVLVSKVEEGSAARAAGVQAGDVILEVDGDKVARGEEIVRAIGDKKKGDAVSIVLLRERARRTLSATMQADADGPAAFGPGVELDLGEPGLRGWRRSFAPVDVGALEKRVAELEKRLAALEQKR